MKCLVTGGAGFIGSNLVDALLARGDEVTVVDDLSTGRRENLDGALAAGAELVELDIRDGAALAALAAEAPPEIGLPPGRPDRRPQVDRGPGLRRRGQRRRHRQRARGGARAPARGRVVFVSTGGAIYGEGDGPAAAARRVDADRARSPPTARASTRPRATSALYERLYGLSGDGAAARQRLRPAPGPARRGRRDRDLLRPAAATAGGRPSSATAPRPATTYMWATSSPRRWPRRRRSATGAGQHRHRPRDRACSSWPRCSASSAARRLRARVRPAARRRGAADLARRRPRRARARLARRRPASRRACALDAATPLVSRPDH